MYSERISLKFLFQNKINLNFKKWIVNEIITKKKVCVEPLCMVSEFVANGSLLDQLKVKTLDSLFFQKLIDLRFVV